jgi:hypothetical protein
LEGPCRLSIESRPHVILDSRSSRPWAFLHQRLHRDRIVGFLHLDSEQLRCHSEGVMTTCWSSSHARYCAGETRLCWGELPARTETLIACRAEENAYSSGYPVPKRGAASGEVSTHVSSAAPWPAIPTGQDIRRRRHRLSASGLVDKLVISAQPKGRRAHVVGLGHGNSPASPQHGSTSLAQERRKIMYYVP